VQFSRLDYRCSARKSGVLCFSEVFYFHPWFWNLLGVLYTLGVFPLICLFTVKKLKKKLTSTTSVTSSSRPLPDCDVYVFVHITSHKHTHTYTHTHIPSHLRGRSGIHFRLKVGLFMATTDCNYKSSSQAGCLL
jgi:hypothetical protein